MNPLALQITGFQKWVDFLKALAFVCGGAYASVVFALDSRYASKESIEDVGKSLRAAIIQSDINSVNRRIAAARVQGENTESESIRTSRQQEIILLESERDELKADLEDVEDE